MPEVAKDILNIGVVGAGTMGAGIVQLVAQQGYKVKLFDADGDKSKQACASIKTILERLVEKQRITKVQLEQTLANIQVISTFAELADSDLVIEAIIEEITAKQQLFSELEAICSSSCLLATNTSTLSITKISAVLKYPERFIGIHFFNPVPLMKLVEIIYGLSTSDATLNATKKLVHNWGKSEVVCKSTPGFIVNRIARPFYAEPLEIVQTSDLDVSVIDGLLKSSGQFKMGAFELIDLIGVDVNYRNTYSIFSAFYFDKRYKPSILQEEYVDAGFWGRKTGKGFYEHNNTEHNNTEIKTAYQILLASKAKQSIAPSSVTFNCHVNCHVNYHVGRSGLENPLFDKLLEVFKNSEINCQAINSEQPNSSKQSAIGQINEDISYIEINNTKCFIHTGQTARELGLQYQQNVCVLDWVVNWANPAANNENAQSVGFSYYSHAYPHTSNANLSTHPSNATEKEQLIEIFQALNIMLVELPDVPGLVVARTLAMLINEACDAIHQRVCSEADADTSVKLGLNYRYGLFELGEMIGWQQVQQLIQSLQDFYQLERYRISPLLAMKTMK